MLFLIEYNRSEGRITSIKSFKDSERIEAQDSMLGLELDLHAAGTDREVVLLEAKSEEAIRLTHARYVENLEQLMARLQRAASRVAAKYL